MKKPQLTTKLLQEYKPPKWQPHWGEYSRIGIILDNYSITEKINYLIKTTYYETTLNNTLNKDITEHILMLDRHKNYDKNKRQI